jgi:hypothetical protein
LSSPAAQAVQTLAIVQQSAFAQLVPSLTGLQVTPDCGSQLQVLHGSGGTSSATLPLQVPSSVQASLSVQALPSSQLLPDSGVCTHKPSVQASSVQVFWSSQAAALSQSAT